MSTEAGARANALDLFRLDGKTALVTGGGRGLGQYMAEALSDAGARVVLCSRKKEALEEVKTEIEGRGGEALALACDVTDPEDVDRAVAETEEAFGVIDVLVNTSKGAVISMTRTLATSWAKHGINVNAIAPGWIPTKMSGGLIEQFEEKMLGDIPLHRFGNPEEKRGAVLSLAPPAAAYVTGQTVVVDGGATVL